MCDETDLYCCVRHWWDCWLCLNPRSHNRRQQAMATTNGAPTRRPSSKRQDQASSWLNVAVPVAARWAAAVPARTNTRLKPRPKRTCRADTVVWVNSTSKVYGWAAAAGPGRVYPQAGRSRLPRCQDCKRRGNLISRAGDTGLRSQVPSRAPATFSGHAQLVRARLSPSGDDPCGSCCVGLTVAVRRVRRPFRGARR